MTDEVVIIDKLSTSNSSSSSSSTSPPPAAAPDIDLCAICLDSWTCPMIFIPCAHVFCESCIKTLPDKICPTCRAPFTQTLYSHTLVQLATHCNQSKKRQLEEKPTTLSNKKVKNAAYMKQFKIKEDNRIVEETIQYITKTFEKWSTEGLDISSGGKFWAEFSPLTDKLMPFEHQSHIGKVIICTDRLKLLIQRMRTDGYTIKDAFQPWQSKAKKQTYKNSTVQRYSGLDISIL